MSLMSSVVFKALSRSVLPKEEMRFQERVHVSVPHPFPCLDSELCAGLPGRLALQDTTAAPRHPAFQWLPRVSMITGRVRGSSAGSQVHTRTQTLQPPPTLYQPSAKGSRLSPACPVDVCKAACSCGHLFGARGGLAGGLEPPSLEAPERGVDIVL